MILLRLLGFTLIYSRIGLLQVSATRFQSLRFQLLGPLIAAAMSATLVVALGSYWFGLRRATADLQTRFKAVENALAESSFPLNQSVLDLLANLTQTELVAIDRDGRIQHATIDGLSPDLLTNDVTFVAGRVFHLFRFPTLSPEQRPDQTYQVAVLFDQQAVNTIGRRAAMFPLIAGLSTIAALTTITMLLSNRLVNRIGRLQQRVEAVAAGDFRQSVSDQGGDEIGRLGIAVDSMAGQLDHLWRQVNRQQGQKLLHQIAAGMAHQLRNSLTGARMAVELHQAACVDPQDEGLNVAVHQIEVSEDYVRRLLLVAAGQPEPAEPSALKTCWRDVQSNIEPLARHWDIAIDWRWDESIADHNVGNGATWIAAATNLIHNAIQAGHHVDVALQFDTETSVRLTVRDDGPGVRDDIADELFEPLVTSKSEGMGLGLSVVRRAARDLGGQVSWYRDGTKTVFEFTAITSSASRCESTMPVTGCQPR